MGNNSCKCLKQDDKSGLKTAKQVERTSHSKKDVAVMESQMDLQDLQEDKSHEEKLKETEIMYQNAMNTSQKELNQADTSITDKSPKQDASYHSKASVKEVVQEQKEESMVEKKEAIAKLGASAPILNSEDREKPQLSESEEVRKEQRAIEQLELMRSTQEEHKQSQLSDPEPEGKEADDQREMTLVKELPLKKEELEEKGEAEDQTPAINQAEVKRELEKFEEPVEPTPKKTLDKLEGAGMEEFAPGDEKEPRETVASSNVPEIIVHQPVEDEEEKEMVNKVNHSIGEGEPDEGMRGSDGQELRVTDASVNNTNTTIKRTTDTSVLVVQREQSLATKINNNEPMSTKSIGAFSSTTEMQRAVDEDSGSDTSFKKVEDDGSNYQSSVHRKFGNESKYSDENSQGDFEGEEEVFRLEDNDRDSNPNKSPLSTKNDTASKKHFNLEVNTGEDDLESAKKLEDDE